MSEYSTGKYDKEQIAEMLSDLCNDLKQGNRLDCNHVVLTFSSLKGQLCSLDAFALNSSLHLVATESWSDFIAPSYDHILNEDELEVSQQEDIPIGLTKAAIKRKQEREGLQEDLTVLKEQESKNNINQNGDQ